MPEAQQVGSTANSYAIVAKLATGGMADIFLARTKNDAGVERYVVLKRVLRNRATDIKFIHMFLDEARLASQLQHPNIAQVYDTGKLGDSYFFTMEYVHGETVRELMQRACGLGQSVPIGCALTIIAGAAAGLQHAHERVGIDGEPLCIVHRDVSPSNLMISYEGNIKLVDFGVAKARLQSTETQAGTVKGKIGYMAPEQCRGGIVDQRCDLFSLGIMLWELLTCERLFKRNTEFESMEAVVNEPTPPPSSRRADLPPALDAIALRLLAKRPGDRFQTAEEVHEAIERAAVSIGVPLSVPALRRYVRELFGARPEPWVEMRLREVDAPEVVTVTGHAFKEDTAELRLERVLDLRSTTVAESFPPGVDGPTPIASGPSHLRPTTAPTVSGPAVPAAVLRPSPAGQPDATMVPRSRRRAVAVGLTAIGIASGAVVFARGSSSGESTAPSADASTTPVARVADAAPAERGDAGRTMISAPLRDAAVVAEQPADLAMLMKEQRFAEVMARCESSAVVAEHAGTCALAACRVHDAEHARSWLSRVAPSERDALVATCAGVGTQLAKREPRRAPPPPPKVIDVTKEPPREAPKEDRPKCDPSDPMACRR